jgi:hypothetical protein
MWEQWNAVLHDTQLDSSRMVRNAETNNAITKLYAQVDVFAAEDRWYFDVPLTIRLCKPLRSRCQWLIKIDEDREKLLPEMAVDFHNLVAKTLYATKQATPDTCTAVAFLMTRVRALDKDDWN